MEKRVSLKDIAKEVGVSVALVSYVLNNQKENRIGKEVAAKIRETAKKLNYRPNYIAKSLKTNKTYTIGLIVADISNTFFSGLARIIEEEAEKSKYTVLYGSSDEIAERSQKLMNVFLDRQVDGLIVAPTEGTEDHIRQLQQKGFPLVLIDRYFPSVKTNYIGVNNYESAYACGRHLAEAGCKRIGIICFKTSLLNLQDRKNGFIQALKDRQLPVTKKQVLEVSLDATEEEVEKSLQQLLAGPEPVDGLFFTSNKLSVYGLKYINRSSILVPGDLAICSFDQSDATEIFYAPLTHIRQPMLEMGQQAVHLLLQAIEKGGEPTHLHLSAELVAGLST